MPASFTGGLGGSQSRLPLFLLWGCHGVAVLN